MTTWNLWECEKGRRWSTVKDYEDPKMKGVISNTKDGDLCDFSGCDTSDGHAIKNKGDTVNRSVAHEWFRRPGRKPCGTK